MKPLHLIPATDGNVWSRYIQVKNDFVYSVNAKELVRFPVAEVFGEKRIKPEEVLFFSKDLWETSKVSEATKITREGNIFYCYAKAVLIGILTPFGQVGATENVLETGKILILFPEFENALQPFLEAEPMFKIGINADSLFNISEAAGISEFGLLRYNTDSVYHFLTPRDTPSGKMIGLSAGLEGLVFEVNPLADAPDYQNGSDIEHVENQLHGAQNTIDGLKDNISEKDFEIANLKEELEEFQAKEIIEIDLCGSTLKYEQPDNLFLQEIMDGFTEIFSQCGNPRELLDTMRLMS